MRCWAGWPARRRRTDRQRGRRHQPAARPAPVAGTAAPGPADDRRAQHERHRAPPRHERRSGSGSPRSWVARWWRPWPWHPGGERALLAQLASVQQGRAGAVLGWSPLRREEIEATQREVRRILNDVGYREPLRARALARIDAVVMHPVAGPAAAGGGAVPGVPGRVQLGGAADGWIDAGVGALGGWLQGVMPAGPLRSLLVDGVIAGTGSVLVFLPQILILFFFILVLEDRGYLPRAAFLLDRLMGRVGLSGRVVHSAAVVLRLRHSRHHGRAHHSQSARPARHHPAGAADDLFGAPAGVRAADRRLHPGAQVRLRQSAGPGAVRAVCRGRAVGAAGGLRDEALHHALELPAAADGTARIPLAQSAQPGDGPVGARQDLPDARRRHHPGADDRAVVPQHAIRRRRPAPPARPSSTALPACWAARCSMCSRPIGFNWQISIALVPGPGRARGGGGRAGHRVCAFRRVRQCGCRR